ncbi:MICOS complex subunit MIC19-like [Microcaecilia unicolor]|uniref:MICOS complex subunit MIC19-like n=1 Tax=Microcaecilia unicolor TaxID=1415580 RepID=A0A6P7YI06_9AMPH|nr:MICOS complex subunit MIC19-like [Microcaecilia unicolor]
MGGSASTRRVSFEVHDNDNITVEKDIRLSDNVINHMKEPSAPAARPQPPSSDSPGFTVNEAELERKIAEELALEQARRETDTQNRLEQDKRYTREGISRILEREKNAAHELLTRALLWEKRTTEEVRLKTKCLAKQIEEKDRILKKQAEYYKEQLANLEERSDQFYNLTTEQYQKAANDVENKFKLSEVFCVQGSVFILERR